MEKVGISVLLLFVLQKSHAQVAAPGQARALDSTARGAGLKRYVAATGKEADATKPETKLDTIIITGPNGIKRRVILKAAS